MCNLGKPYFVTIKTSTKLDIEPQVLTQVMELLLRLQCKFESGHGIVFH